MDMEKLAAAMAPVIRRLVGAAMAPLLDRIKELEDRKLPEAIKGDPGRDGADGKDAEPLAAVDVAAVLLASDELRTLVDLHAAEAVADHLQRNPPAAGQPGKDGEPGRDGEPGLDGRDGVDGNDGEAGKDGRDGIGGKDGKDGASVVLEDVERVLQGKMAEWALDFERRAQGVLERAVERMPKPADGKDGRDGADGKDGLGFEDLDVEQVGDRGAVLKFARGEVVREFPLAFPVVIDRGVYKADSDYQRGDGVTFGGSWWVAQKDAPDGKPGLSDGWRLAVKKGRDGKDGKDGQRGPEGRAGKVEQRPW